MHYDDEYNCNVIKPLQMKPLCHILKCSDLKQFLHLIEYVIYSSLSVAT